MRKALAIRLPLKAISNSLTIITAYGWQPSLWGNPFSSRAAWRKMNTMKMAMKSLLKLKVMRLLPVTSLMTKAQLSKYLEAVQADFGSRGVVLAFPMEAAA